jgi:dolichol-phosphate mannosyltransferase
MDKPGPELSVVVPLLDEQDNIGSLYEQISQALAKNCDYEIVFVDDGSRDDSFIVLAGLQKNDARKDHRRD